MLDGKVHVGVLKHEDDKSLKLMTATGSEIIVRKEDIDERNSEKSAMPEDFVKKLSKADLRDLVEYLSQQK